MLIKYEYELLSYIASYGISKVNGDILIKIEKIGKEIGVNIDYYLEILEQKNLINLLNSKVLPFPQ